MSGLQGEASGLGLERIETPRLVGERAELADLAAICALFQDPRVAATISPTASPQSSPELSDLLDRDLAHWERHDFGIWLLRDKHSGEVVGRGGLLSIHLDDRDEVEAAWAIAPARWRQGLATELALACVEIGFQRLGLSSMVAMTLPHNAASRRVMEKASFAYERDIEHAGLPHVLYRARPRPRGSTCGTSTDIRTGSQPIQGEAFA